MSVTKRQFVEHAEIKKVPGIAQMDAPNRPAYERLGHRPGLDAVRGSTWVCVFCAHAGVLPIAGIGDVAMFVFFALSGFLITALLVEEHMKRGAIAIGHFFRRRALRLLPALGLFLLVWLAVVAIFGREPWMTTVPGGGSGAGERFMVAMQGVGAAFGYVTNWLTIFHGFTGYVPLGHLWSLAVEEQIYLVWAPVVAILLIWCRRRTLAIVATLCAVLSTVEVAILWRHGVSNRIYMGTDTRAGAFLFGSAIAFAWSLGYFHVLRRTFVRRTLAVIAVIALIRCAIPLVHPLGVGQYVLVWATATLASGALIVSVVEADCGGISRSVWGRVLTYLGRRSYALYLWHYVWLTWLRDFGDVGVVLAFFFTVCSAELSWHLVEKRALKLRDRKRAAINATQRPVVLTPVVITSRECSPAAFASEAS